MTNRHTKKASIFVGSFIKFIPGGFQIINRYQFSGFSAWFSKGI